MQESLIRQAEVWAIGGGKGGTGKSFLTSSIALSLADDHKRVILIDADLGGPNLHSFLGQRKPKRTLTDFFEKGAPLGDLVVDAGLGGIGFISGNLQSMEADSIKYTQKLKLFRQIRSLDADLVLIDLGAGANHNTLDAFLLADRMVAVTVPAVTALENLYQFIKNVYFRKLKNSFANHGLKDLVTERWKNREAHGIQSLKGLVEHLRQLPEASGFFAEEVDNFTVSVALNKVRTSEDIQLGNSIKSVVRKYLGLNAEYSGYVRYEENILRCLNNGTPYIRTFPSSRGTIEIKKLARNILSGRRIKDLG